jgi:hypothetical protein
MGVFYRPPCPKCKTTARLALITLSSSGFDIRTFKCPVCRHVYQRVEELIDDPMKSQEISGWLRGELRPPT